jgi:hypothetical protein
MTGSAYGAAALTALSMVSGPDPESIKRLTNLWLHAHQLE